MAFLTRSSDILRLCFVFSGYDLDSDMAAVIERVEIYEEENSCFFGTGPEDFKNSFFWLAHAIGAVGMSDFAIFLQTMKRTRLRDLARPILEKRELYCNDEGEYWTGEYLVSGGFADRIENWYNDPADPVDLTYEYNIRRFFETPRNVTNQSMIDFFRRYNTESEIISRNFTKRSCL